MRTRTRSSWLPLAVAILLLAPAASAVVFFSLVVPAQATLIDLGGVTRDSDQGIDWLDLTETNGLSVNDALAMFPGWGTADGSQVCGFVRQAVPTGLDPSFYRCGGGSPVQFSGARPPWEQIGLWGFTSKGMSNSLWGNNEEGTAGIFRIGLDTGGVDIWTLTTSGTPAGSYRSIGVDFNTATAGIGVFLVRPIPEPSTALLLATGLATLAAVRRRRSR
jgi:hypothetical protein